MVDETVDRRQVLKWLGAVGAECSLVGCSGVQSPLRDGSSGGQSKTNDTQPVACANTSASHIFTFGRDGYTIVVTNRSTANATVDTLYSSPQVPPRVGTEPYVNVRDAGGQFTVRLKDTNASLSDVQTVLGDQDGVKNVRRGHPVSKLEAEARGVEDLLTAGESGSDVAKATAVTPGGDEAPYVAVSLFDPPQVYLIRLRPRNATELRVQTASGEQRVATGRDFRGEVVVRNSPSIGRYAGLVVNPAARAELLSALREVGVLSEPNTHPLRLYSGRTLLTEFTLSSESVTSMQSGDWSGQVAVPVDSLRAGRRIAWAFEPTFRDGTLVSCE